MIGVGLRFRLPKEFGQKWIKELKTTEKSQGTGKLVDATWLDQDQQEYEVGSERYCCLGVAASMCGFEVFDLIHQEIMDNNPDIFIQKGVPLELTGSTTKAAGQQTSLVGIVTRLNDGLPLIIQTSLLKENPSLIFHKKHKKNSNYPVSYTFAEIAQWLEENIDFY